MVRILRPSIGCNYLNAKCTDFHCKQRIYSNILIAAAADATEQPADKSSSASSPSFADVLHSTVPPFCRLLRICPCAVSVQMCCCARHTVCDTVCLCLL